MRKMRSEGRSCQCRPSISAPQPPTLPPAHLLCRDRLHRWPTAPGGDATGDIAAGRKSPGSVLVGGPGRQRWLARTTTPYGKPPAARRWTHRSSSTGGTTERACSRPCRSFPSSSTKCGMTMWWMSRSLAQSSLATVANCWPASRSPDAPTAAMCCRQKSWSSDIHLRSGG